LQESADALAECPNYWIPRDVVEAGAAAARSPAERAVARLHELVQHSLPDAWSGAEYWVQASDTCRHTAARPDALRTRTCAAPSDAPPRRRPQVYQNGSGLAWHFDKDEQLLLKEGRVVTPLLSSVLYLTGAAGGPLQGPTVVTDQRFDPGAQRPEPDDPTCSTLVFPRANAYCLFGGALGHGVLDSGSAERRATLLVNWWADKPAAVDRAPAGEAEQAARGGGAEAAVEAQSEEVAVVTVTVAEADLQESQLVDDILAAAGVAVGGARCVRLRHPGLAMCPVDGEQLRAAEGEVQVGAAFVSLADMDASSSSSSSGEEGNEAGRPCVAHDDV
jgi:hypothetical protein